MAEIQEILSTAVQYRASDILLVPNQPPVLRVDGALAKLPGVEPGNPTEVKRWVYSLMDERLRAEFERTREADFAYSLAGVGRFRVNVFYQGQGVASALRFIPTEIPTAEQLGLSPAILNLGKLPRGLVLVTGPTGSGKTSTLAALVESINVNQNKHILTIEDPIEFLYANKGSIINQREVGTHTDSFSKALKYALRQNPDIILVGEMRDMETISLAMSAAETGHLCLSTLHTQDAATTINRVIDEFPTDQHAKVRAQLCGVLSAVVSQVLLPRKGGGRACSRELMLMNPAISTLIRENKINQIYGALEAGGGSGMISMDQSLANLVIRGIVDLEQAALKARDPQAIRKLINITSPGGAGAQRGPMGPTGPTGPVPAGAPRPS
jgi:twitching motility protein PilT